MKLNNIFQKIEFTNLKELDNQEFDIILDIRNEDDIRNNMLSKNIILSSDHKNWINKIKNSKDNFFFAVKYEEKIIGGLAINVNPDKKEIADWAFYLSTKKNFIGLGFCLEIKALDFIFKKFRLNELQCLVFFENKKVHNLHKKIGFDEIPYENMHISFPNHNKFEKIICLSIKKSKWIKKREEIKIKYFF